MNSEKCQFCGKPATVHMTQIINSETTVVHMCSECAAKRGLLDQEGLPFAMLSNISEALFAGIKQQMPLNGLICSECGCTPMSFKETGRLGCPNCYKDLKLLVNAIVESSQKGMTHTGKHPYSSESSDEQKTDMDASNCAIRKTKKKIKEQKDNDLQNQLALAVKEERYEDAARIRDKIKASTNGKPAKSGNNG